MEDRFKEQLISQSMEIGSGLLNAFFVTLKALPIVLIIYIFLLNPNC